MHQFRRGGVFGDFGSERFNAAALLHDVAPPEHRLALREAEAGALAGILPARFKGVEKRALELGGEVFRIGADRRRTDNPAVVAPARQQAKDVVLRHKHIRIGDNDPLVPRRPPALDDIVELGVGADAIVADQQPRRDARICVNVAPDQRRDRIGRIGDTEHYLVFGIIERENRSQGLARKALDAAQRLHDRHRRRSLGPRSGRLAAAASVGGKQSGEGVKRQPGRGKAGRASGYRHLCFRRPLESGDPSYCGACATLL